MPSEYKRSTCLLNQWVRKSCGWSQQKPRLMGAEEYFPLKFYALIVEVEICGITIYRVEVQSVSGSGNFHSFPLGRRTQAGNYLDLNSIHHLWYLIGCDMNRRPLAQTVANLCKVVDVAWQRDFVQKNIGRNRPVLPQSFKQSSPAEEYGTVLRTPTWQICT
ncbi:hypothetical protein TNCV_4291941 [Trichonephila clavipes]|uniref:Uncharacterized protein n=1 Tax=Trichonephila clavipes TaxID=2585209 RepID=A0A8X6RKP1_TRICX|nr:hypothetical protein TNCV_4291941 [Trichonephila clavipes]